MRDFRVSRLKGVVYAPIPERALRAFRAARREANEGVIRTSNAAEREFVADALARGWRVIRGGWPDFIVVRGDAVRFVEVKPRGGALDPKQREVSDILKARGVGVELWTPRPVKKKRGVGSNSAQRLSPTPAKFFR